ncbi:hypothetical protein LTR56_014887 [Elasticomyces elasticus]|nr:hypothetical protein LTR22_021190 [Elasticomyces elasticus]KAK3635115.1 hypothetical protein LTR56_014887 [Elasticomyces elasticus]KAK5749900.1 hypothetical protein LTS12_020046 [Elasticomyces elasticus]
MTRDEISNLRASTRDLFYHGYDNYLLHAFPEDELRPISCQPQTRNADNPADIGLNDVLGNYSVTLIDSLSTLAILASDTDEGGKHGAHALREFQNGVKALVELYGDGTEDEDGRKTCGSRACGFDLDSKVQVFETNIRGVGGLLSAHLFAIGELPILNYNPASDGSIHWSNDFVYNGQLLTLAHDLASRLLPAFSTSTGLPYPRVNLRHGIHFYGDAEAGVCRVDGTSSGPREITETCSAGAGSLVLEFTTLSRLTGDFRFELAAKRAFWAVWERRSNVGLIGGGLDAETGSWTMPPLAGIGAGVDSFFEYAFKSSILLSGLGPPPTKDPDKALAFMHNPSSYLRVWETSHTAIKRHIYRSTSVSQFPYYAQSDLLTGAPRYTWIDNLSAYYPGLLALAGEVEEGVESHMLFSALWTRYSALPERWQVGSGGIDVNFRHWAGRPEFIESTWYLYQATRDPWYLHVGEMVIRDIRRRCWAKCGWADLSDVVGGEQRDRMESFFLGETVKYLYLLFDEEHPLNKGDRAVVFSTEGHPLVIPERLRARSYGDGKVKAATSHGVSSDTAPTCPAPPPSLPLTISHLANRGDLFHAAALTQLHLVPINPTRSSPLMEVSRTSPGISLQDVRSPTNYTFYPWTLPQTLIPPQGTSAVMKRSPVVSTLTFPNLNLEDGGVPGPQIIGLGALQKVVEGVLINSLSNLRLSMIQQPKSVGIGGTREEEFRIQGIANWALGRDEKVMVTREAVRGVSAGDPHFSRVKDLEGVDLVVDAVAPSYHEGGGDGEEDGDGVVEEWEVEVTENGTLEGIWGELEEMVKGLLSSSGSLGGLGGGMGGAGLGSAEVVREAGVVRHVISAILPTGAGAAPLPPLLDSANEDLMQVPAGGLPIKSIFFLDSTLCPPYRLPAAVAKGYNVLVVRRGDCSFGEKLASIPSFAPSDEALQLVIILSVPESRSEGEQRNTQGQLIRPLLDEVQRTPNGFERRNALAMVMVDGDEETVGVLRGAARGFGAFDERGKFVELKQDGESTGGKDSETGLGVKRRYWFESMGVPIGNLIML